MKALLKRWFGRGRIPEEFAKLAETEHMLKWFSKEPYEAIRSGFEKMLREQVADSKLKGFRVLSAPQWLTGGRPSDCDGGTITLVRSGVAFEFEAVAESKGQSDKLAGVFTWVVIHLDKPGQQEKRVWMDLGGTLKEFGSEGKLKLRVYYESMGI